MQVGRSDTGADLGYGSRRLEDSTNYHCLDCNETSALTRSRSVCLAARIEIIVKAVFPSGDGTEKKQGDPRVRGVGLAEYAQICMGIASSMFMYEYLMIKHEIE